jgi:myo-inositol catabolism protein IolC
MSLGYNQRLYLLPFDHRHSYLAGMFHASPPLTTEQRQAVIGSKRVIYDGFRLALICNVSSVHAGILVDEEFAADILRNATRHGYVTALSTEKSGSEEFEFEYGAEGDEALNKRQTARLRQLSDYCRTEEQKFMLELLVPATEEQQRRVSGESEKYDREIRPSLVLEIIRTLQDAGVEPDIWKIEGLDHHYDCEQVVATARRDGRVDVGCIVLGRAGDDAKVTSWLAIAASVPGFIGFAVGRTTFWNAIADLIADKSTREEAVSRIAQRYGEWAAIFDRAHVE